MTLEQKESEAVSAIASECFLKIIRWKGGTLAVGRNTRAAALGSQSAADDTARGLNTLDQAGCAHARHCVPIRVHGTPLLSKSQDRYAHP